MGTQDQQDHQEKKQLLKKMDHLEDDQKTKSQAIEDQRSEIKELKDNLQHYQKQMYEQKQLYEVRVQSQEQEIE